MPRFDITVEIKGTAGYVVVADSIEEARTIAERAIRGEDVGGAFPNDPYSITTENVGVLNVEPA